MEQNGENIRLQITISFQAKVRHVYSPDQFLPQIWLITVTFWPDLKDNNELRILCKHRKENEVWLSIYVFL